MGLTVAAHIIGFNPIFPKRLSDILRLKGGNHVIHEFPTSYILLKLSHFWYGIKRYTTQRQYNVNL